MDPRIKSSTPNGSFMKCYWMVTNIVFLSKKVREGTKPNALKHDNGGFLLAKKKRFTGFRVLPLWKIKRNMITSLSQLDLDKSYTYADYLLWQFEERVELIKGKILQMAAPSRAHQQVTTNLIVILGNSKREMKDKFSIYEESGVLEYWIISLSQKAVQVFRLNEQGKYYGTQPFVEGDNLTTPILPGINILLNEVFLD